MTSVALISSTNGLGHARRLSYLAVGFSNLGISTKLFVTEKQASKLTFESKDLGSKINLFKISNHGLDGPSWKSDKVSVTPPSPLVIAELANCSAVISDNVIWPIKYNSNFYLHGHFNWIDYWEKEESLLESTEMDILKTEKSYMRSIKSWFVSEDFYMPGSELSTIEKVKMPLIQYSSKKIEKNAYYRQNQIWNSNGTTKLNIDSKFARIAADKVKHQVIVAETFQLAKVKEFPSCVIGRPGLGTIRDCLEAGIPFLPVWEGSDPELESNAKHLLRMGLIPDIFVDTFDIIDFLNNDLEIEKLGEKWQETWPKISLNLGEYCARIINQISKGKDGIF
jgi:hypothetical protein